VPMSSMQPCVNDFVGARDEPLGIEAEEFARPSQVRHMPCGLLTLKSCGVGSSKLMPHSVQAKWAERTMSPG